MSKTIVIVGAGAIGSKVAEIIATETNLHVRICDPAPVSSEDIYDGSVYSISDFQSREFRVEALAAHIKRKTGRHITAIPQSYSDEVSPAVLNSDKRVPAALVILVCTEKEGERSKAWTNASQNPCQHGLFIDTRVSLYDACMYSLMPSITTECGLYQTMLDGAVNIKPSVECDLHQISSKIAECIMEFEKTGDYTALRVNRPLMSV